MKEFQEKRKIKKRVYSKFTILALLIVVILLARGTWGVYKKEKDSRIEMQRVQGELQVLKDRKENLAIGIDRLKTDTGVEEEIRNKFQVAKQGEGVIVIVDKAPTVVPTDDTNILKKIWNSVTGVFGGGKKATTTPMEPLAAGTILINASSSVSKTR